MKVALCLLLFAWVVNVSADDWPQWRGPMRNGVVPGSADLPETLGEENAPVKLWETTEEIPSDHYGGHGSVAVAGGKVYLSLVWHRDQPTETRRIDGDVLSKLDYRGTGSLPPEVVEKMETDRQNLSRRLRGEALEQWAQEWVDANIDEKTKLSLGGWIIGRFKKGQTAIPLQVYETLRTVSNRVFESQAEVEAWVNEQKFEPAIRDQIIAAIPNTMKVADDVVMCLDAASGSEVWRFKAPGFPSGRASSSTPAVADGKVYAALSEKLYCLEADSGQVVWESPLSGKKGPASSPLVLDGKVYLLQNALTAWNAADGSELWKNAEVKGSNSSPVAWKQLIIANSQGQVVATDRETGTTVWSVPGGGDATPAVVRDTLVVTSTLDGKNLIAYDLTETGAKERWAHGFLAQRYSASPIVHEGYVYHLCSDRHLCLDLATGAVKWERQAQSSISSPLLADGKLLVYENRGGFVSLLRAGSDSYEVVGKAKVGALYCASPALVGKTIYLRTAKSVAAYQFQ
ncbi:MAG: PQQ-like beta-propeller repeat protein [Verrucomicrobiales bacterium]|nr:PQQ-like beta-propeller repeat protein [Verrucomicrobiales bacterium]